MSPTKYRYSDSVWRKKSSRNSALQPRVPRWISVIQIARYCRVATPPRSRPSGGNALAMDRSRGLFVSGVNHMVLILDISASRNKELEILKYKQIFNVPISK